MATDNIFDRLFGATVPEPFAALMQPSDAPRARRAALLGAGTELLANGTERPGIAGALGTALQAGTAAYQDNLTRTLGVRKALTDEQRELGKQRMLAEGRASLFAQYGTPVAGETTADSAKRLLRIQTGLLGIGDVDGAKTLSEVIKSMGFDADKADVTEVDTGDGVDIVDNVTGKTLYHRAKGQTADNAATNAARIEAARIMAAARGANAGKMNVTQARIAGINHIVQSGQQELSKLAGDNYQYLVGNLPSGSSNLPGFLGRMARTTLTPAQKQYNIALGQFLTGIYALSGANINEAENDRNMRLYGYEGGDDAETMKMKERARDAFVEGLKIMSSGTRQGEDAIPELPGAGTSTQGGTLPSLDTIFGGQ